MDPVVTPKPVICIFAKPARPGQAKTRLAGQRGKKGAAALARAFFRDTWQSVSTLAWARTIVATTDTGSHEWNSIPGDSLWPQGSGDLGERLERVVRRALGESDIAIAIGADTPGLPERLLLRARDAIQVADGALGPADDGGFYLLALRRCAPGLLRDLPWSEATTFAATRARLEACGMSVGVLEPWFDVDRPEDLVRLRELIARGEVVAPATAALLTRLAEDHDRCA